MKRRSRSPSKIILSLRKEANTSSRLLLPLSRQSLLKHRTQRLKFWLEKEKSFEGPCFQSRVSSFSGRTISLVYVPSAASLSDEWCPVLWFRIHNTRLNSWKLAMRNTITVYTHLQLGFQSQYKFPYHVCVGNMVPPHHCMAQIVFWRLDSRNYEKNS